MTKTRIIIVSVIALIIAMIGILFGAVFRLRRQKVVFIDNDTIGISSAEIINSANFKKGSSILFLDKEKATNNIEKQFPTVKVVHIKTVSAIDVQIIVRKRHHMFTTTVNGLKYFMDEDLKVLETSDVDYALADLIEIPSKYFNINSNTTAGDFVGKNDINKTTYSLVKSMLEVVKIGDNYCERENILNLIDNIDFQKGYLATGENSYNRIIITTKTGLTIDIGKPENNLAYKINTCFATYFNLSEAEKTTGTIKVTYHPQSGQELILHDKT